MNAFSRSVWTGIRVMVILTVLLGVVYPLAILGIGQVLFPRQANGSIVSASDGQAVGSSLIGQSFTDVDGNPLPKYFQSRPSAAGDGYDARVSSGSNLGPENEELISTIIQRRAGISKVDKVPEVLVPVDAVTASGSGLDPHISPAYASLQADRVAMARNLPPAEVRALLHAHTQSPFLGYLGQSRVNVVELNLALDQLP